jgi:uncharacterized protein
MTTHSKKCRKAAIGAAKRFSAEELRAAVRRWVWQIAVKFCPERVILFGSQAYGRPHAESDVDILVVMPAANEVNQSIRMRLAVEPPFPLDLIVRTPRHLQRGLEDGDPFLREVIARGKVLYEEGRRAVGPKGRSRRCRSTRVSSRKARIE